jgi:GMP synthase (glutamine-hydrolysing)
MGYIYILNYGDYFARLTAKKVRQAGGRPKIVSFNTPYADLKKPVGFIVSGSPNGSMRIPVRLLTKELFSTNFPIMGICVGAQLITRFFGGKYGRFKRQAENGQAELHLHRKNKLLKGIKEGDKVFMMHEDSICDPGKDFWVVASTERCKIAATQHKKWRWYTFQFHPELSNSTGEKIFKNFVELCYRDEPDFKPKKSEVKLFLEEGGRVEEGGNL